MKVRAKRERLK